MSTIRVVQYFELLALIGSDDQLSSTNSELRMAKYFANMSNTDGITLGKRKDTLYHRYQNYFVNETVRWPTVTSPRYAFVPFKVEGTTANLGGENSLLQVLFPNVEAAVRLVEQGNGNRLSRLTLTTVWLNAESLPLSGKQPYQERYIGVGAGFSDTTIELRFRSAMDSVGAQFPSRKFSRSSVGLLPLNADIVLR